MKKSLIYNFFFGNYFYGICAVALTIEATLQQQFPFNSLPFYIFSFSATALYYTRAYVTESPSVQTNPRTQWYWVNRKQILLKQILLACICLVYLCYILLQHYSRLLFLPIQHWILLAIFPLIALFYYGYNHPFFRKFQLRNIGWLKPFIIGFVWAGLINIYPILFYNIEHAANYTFDFIGIFLFIKNLMFIAVLCIMFDIKDYAADHNRQLKTFVVKIGLRKTIFYTLIPLCIIGLGSFIYYAVMREFSIGKILLNTLPFLLLLTVAYSMHKRKSILYYLIVIDGLMLVKAFCGTMAMIYF